MRTSFKSARRLDLGTAALVVGGVALVAVSVVAGAAVLQPTAAVETAGVQPTLNVLTPTPISGRPSVALAADRVATVLLVDATMGAGSAARSGDRIDVLGYFSRQIMGAEGLTRMLLQDVPVLTVDRSGSTVALTLSVPHAGALLLQEAQAMGARPFVALRSGLAVSDSDSVPPSFSDTNLAQRLAGGR